MQIKLPDDLKAFAKKNKTKKIIVFAILILVFFSIAFFSFYFFRNKSISYSLIVLVFCSFLLFFALKAMRISSIVFDTTYFGTIEKVEVKTKVSSETPEKPTRESLKRYNYTIIEIREKSGRKSRHVIQKSSFSNNDSPQIYDVGNDVLHIAGSNYTVVVNKKNESQLNCCICGMQNVATDEKCVHCGYTLVKRISE